MTDGEVISLKDLPSEMVQASGRDSRNRFRLPSGGINLGKEMEAFERRWVQEALEQAKKQGLLTIGLTGYDGGKIMRSAAVDFCINVPSDHIPRIQEAQATVYHALLEVIYALGEQDRIS